MSEQTANLIKENVDHARKSCFNTARKIISRSLRETKVGDATVTQMARDAFHDAVVEVITRALPTLPVRSIVTTLPPSRPSARSTDGSGGPLDAR